MRCLDRTAWLLTLLLLLLSFPPSVANFRVFRGVMRSSKCNPPSAHRIRCRSGNAGKPGGQPCLPAQTPSISIAYLGSNQGCSALLHLNRNRCKALPRSGAEAAQRGRQRGRRVLACAPHPCNIAGSPIDAAWVCCGPRCALKRSPHLETSTHDRYCRGASPGIGTMQSQWVSAAGGCRRAPAPSAAHRSARLATHSGPARLTPVSIGASSGCTQRNGSPQGRRAGLLVAAAAGGGDTSGSSSDSDGESSGLKQLKLQLRLLGTLMVRCAGLGGWDRAAWQRPACATPPQHRSTRRAAPCRFPALIGSAAVAAGFFLHIDALGNFHWNEGDAVLGLQCALPILLIDAALMLPDYSPGTATKVRQRPHNAGVVQQLQQEGSSGSARLRQRRRRSCRRADSLHSRAARPQRLPLPNSTSLAPPSLPRPPRRRSSSRCRGRWQRR